MNLLARIRGTAVTRQLLSGWECTRFAAWEIAEATGSTWELSASVDGGGFEVMLLRFRLSYTRTTYREARP